MVLFLEDARGVGTFAWRGHVDPRLRPVGFRRALGLRTGEYRLILKGVQSMLKLHHARELRPAGGFRQGTVEVITDHLDALAHINVLCIVASCEAFGSVRLCCVEHVRCFAEGHGARLLLHLLLSFSLAGCRRSLRW